MNYLRGIFSFFLLAVVFSFGPLPVGLAAEDAVHVVEKGETVYSLSRLYRISQEELMRYNNLSDASKLQVGQRIRIPAAAGISSYTEYRVIQGDTLYGIARKQGVSFQALCDINQFSSAYKVKVGERIKIPAASVTVTAQSGTSPPASRPAPSDARQTASRNVDSALRWPVAPKEISYMTGKLYGVVVLGERAEAVKSLTQGTVLSAGPYRGFGKVAIVQVAGGYLYVYGGCESLSVKEGDRIGPGTELGKLGIDAVSEKPQLFFMVYRSNTPIDPAKAPRA
jgi:murein DD-endopeptidase MepM/ murein hydrolase activator NlpD